MCQDCPTARSQARGVADELSSWVVLPFVLFAIVLGMALLGGAVTVGELVSLLRD